MTVRRPPIVVALARIGDSDLPAIQRDVLRALLRWWNATTGELWPALQTVADDCGRDVATIRRAVRALEGLGIVEIQERTRGGIGADGRGRTHLIRLHLDRLNPRTGRGLPTGNPSAEDAEPAPVARQTRAYGASNPRPTPDKPSMHELTNEHTIEPAAPNLVGTSPGGCVDGQGVRSTVREALARAGIRGPNLDRLAESGLTPETVEREARDVTRDTSVRNRPAVLVRRLSELAGVKLSKRPDMNPGTREAIAQIESLRRHRGDGGVGDDRRMP